ncbi:MAG: hypothetical protein BMS9Abin26_1122 [Gammaproteobacteria bacterium]|nr:MAG: hypothetical protein BMS9Abin26_1122 [Gammaproteobacteria bacterium]
MGGHDLLMKDVSAVSKHMQAFFSEVLSVVMAKYVADNFDDMDTELVEVPDRPSLDESVFGFFVDESA